MIYRGKGQFVFEQFIFCSRIDVVKVDRFFDFILRLDFFQDVVFGIKNLKFYFGEYIIILVVIRMLIFFCIIEQYKKEVFGFVGECLFFRIFDVCFVLM